MDHAPRFLALVEEARKAIQETDVNSVKSRMDAGEALLLVDVREDNEWQGGHLPGAIHLGKGIIERDAEKVLPDLDAEIILYCGGGYRSALAADNLKKMGYTQAVSMDGGYRSWKESGFPIANPS